MLEQDIPDCIVAFIDIAAVATFPSDIASV